MPSPFSKSKPGEDTAQDAVTVTNSVLTCEVCYQVTSDGFYFPGKKILTFVCPQGHNNTVQNLEL